MLAKLLKTCLHTSDIKSFYSSRNMESKYLCIEQCFVYSLPALLCLLLCLAVGSAIPDVGCDELVFPPKCMAFIPSNIFSFFSLDKGRPWTMAASLFIADDGLDIFLLFTVIFVKANFFVIQSKTVAFQ